jgi:protein SCO1/2
MNTKYILLFFSAISISCAAAAPHLPSANPASAGPSPKESTAAKKADDCCAEAASVPFTKESIYQLDGRFLDDSGRPFALGSLRGHPVALDMFFASCGYACPLTVTDMLAIQKRLPIGMPDPALFVLVSFDTARDTPKALASYRAEHQLGANWILLHGDEDSVRELAALLGVKYKQGADGAFSHSNLVTILNRQGEIVHQRVGLQGGLDEAAIALAAASPVGNR